jgi:hypothetical protein
MSTPLPERPNTVSGLNAKRDELIRYRKQLQAELRKITCDIDHLEAAARLFTDGASFTGFKPYTVAHRARKGTVKRFIMGMLREAQAPLTSAEITEAWLAKRGFSPNDETRVIIRKRIGAALVGLRNQGVARNEGFRDGLKGWVRA